ncbi:hypothetical protein ABH945_001370 [Paraburkholderia sp. GAS333]|uniref:DUF3999 domain-containing protein n=1 Tax=Paraburkholderia sp. GAS333 TaxID=3156279 RepID=UPI003D1D0C37
MKHVLKFTGWCFAIASVGLALPAVAADSFAQRDFAKHFTLQLDDAAASSYSMTLPAIVYAASQRSDLGDIRIFNSTGDTVPYSLDAPRAVARTPSRTRSVGWFPLAPAPAGSSGMPAGVAIAADGSLRATAAPPPRAQHELDLIDLGRVSRTTQVDALVVHLRDDNFQGRVTVEVSDDLRHWQPAGDAQLLKVNYNGSTLSQDRIELSGAHARYLRLHWLDGAPYVDSMDMEIQPVGAGSAQTAGTQREWKEGIVAHTSLKPGEYFFATGGSYPVDRLRLTLPQPNTVVSAIIYSRTGLDKPWREVSSATLFRLHNGTVEQSNAPLELKTDTDRQWRVVVDTRNGGLGSGALTVSAGWRPAALTFVAQGSPPYTLAVGRVEALPAVVSRSTLPVSASSVPGVARLNDETSVAHPASAQLIASAPDASRGYLLWAALLLAVGSLGAIGWRIARGAHIRAADAQGGLANGAGTMSATASDSAATAADEAGDVKG